ncbi:MAG: pilus assembly protein [Gammaproteobacteria bacterium]
MLFSLTKHTKATQQGFALIASLLFLLILTVLGVSSIRNVSLQERMASNLRQKSLSYEAAEAAIAYSEDWLNCVQPDITAPCQPNPPYPNHPYDISTDGAPSVSPATWAIKTGDLYSTTAGADIAAFRGDTLWAKANYPRNFPPNAGEITGTPMPAVPASSPFTSGAVGTTATPILANNPQFFIEEIDSTNLGGSLTPTSQYGKSTTAQVVYYRITARGVGAKYSGAVSVLQNVYAIVP